MNTNPLFPPAPTPSYWPAIDVLAGPKVEEHDPVNHPAHYTSHPSGVECIDITEWHNFNVGNAIKYLWRAGLKGDSIEDLRKAAFYIDREITRVGGLA